MELKRVPAMLVLDWQAAAECKGLKVSKLKPREAESLQRACRMPGIALCEEFGVCKNYRIQAGVDGWDKVVQEKYMIVHRPSQRPLVWGVGSVNEGMGIVERLVNGEDGKPLDWDFTAAEFAKLAEGKKERYRTAVRGAVQFTDAKSALLNGECVGQQQGKATPAPSKAAVGRRVSLAPSKAGTNRVSLKP